MAHQALKLARLLSSWPATCASAAVALLSLAPILLGQRYLGLDHSRVLLAAMCGARGADGAVLDASFGGGGPLLEEPQGLVLYPAAWLLRGFDVELAASLFVVAHLALAAAGAAHLARAKGLARLTPFAFALAFATCGTVLDLILHGPYLVGAAGLALTWAGVARLLARRARKGGVLMLASGPALLLLSGELQGFGIALALVVAEVVVEVVVAVVVVLLPLRHSTAAVDTRRPVDMRASVARVGCVVAAFTSGALIGSAQLALSFALASATARAARVPDPFLWSLSPVQLLGVVWPGNLIARAADGSSLHTAIAGDAMASPPWNLTPFLGAPVLALAVVGVVLCAGRARAVLFAASSRRGTRPVARARMITPSLVAVFATLFALGERTPILAWAITVVPPLGFFRYPAKYFVVASLALLLLAFHALALGSGTALAQSARRHVRVALSLAAAACAVAVVVAFFLGDRVDALGAAVAVRPPWPGEPTLAELLLSRALLAFALALLAALVAFARPRAIAVVVALGLVVPFARGLPLGEPLTSLPARAGVPSSAAGAVVCHGRGIGARHVDRPGEPLGMEGDIIVDWLDLKPNMHQCHDVSVPHAAMSSSQGPTFTLATTLDETAPLPVQAWALGCTHLATRLPAAAIAHIAHIAHAVDDNRAIGVDAPVYALRVPAVDIAVARAPKLYASGDDALAALRTLVAPDDVANVIDDPARALDDPSALARFAVPEEEHGDDAVAKEGAENELQATISWTSTTRGRIELAGGRAGRGAVIAVRRPWWPGFEATQGDRSVPVVRAAGVQLAVVVEDVTGGDVLLAYRVRTAPFAIALPIAGALLLAAVAWAAAWRTKRSKVPG